MLSSSWNSTARVEVDELFSIVESCCDRVARFIPKWRAIRDNRGIWERTEGPHRRNGTCVAELLLSGLVGASHEAPEVLSSNPRPGSGVSVLSICNVGLFHAGDGIFIR